MLDPTLLLSIEDWEKIREDVSIDGKYVFCYFLGNNKKSRILARTFARDKGLSLVTIPHATGDVELSDLGFGDKQLYDISPQQFLSLIKNAEYIFTDSFHAVVFSYLYKRQYFVFHRTRDGAMSTRIQSITELLGSQDHFCNQEERETLSYLKRTPAIDYSEENKAFEKEKSFSIQFLQNYLKQEK